MADPLDLNQLRTFLAVHRSGSFTAAAHLLGLSQSTVTTQIRTLETRLGRELFERRARGVAPLPYADELAAQVASPLDHLSGLTDDGDAPAVEPVHLAGPAEFLGAVGMGLVAPLIADGVQLRVTTGLTDDLLDELRAGRHDLVISTRRPTSRSLISEPFADEEFVLVAAPAWAERLKEAESIEGQALPAALTDIPLIAYDADLPIIRRYWRYVFNDHPATSTQLTTIPDLRRHPHRRGRRSRLDGPAEVPVPRRARQQSPDTAPRARRGSAQHRLPGPAPRRLGQPARGHSAPPPAHRSQALVRRS